MGNLIDHIDTRIMKVGNTRWLSYRTPANYLSVYLYASRFILGVLKHRAIYFGRFDQI